MRIRKMEWGRMHAPVVNDVSGCLVTGEGTSLKDLEHPIGVSFLEFGNLSVVPSPVTKQPSLI